MAARVAPPRSACYSPAMPGTATRTSFAAALAIAFLGGVAANAADDCCSCAVGATKTFASPQLPCLFDYPAEWKGPAGSDGAIVSAVLGPESCGTVCSSGSPNMSVSYGTKPDSNAETMEAIWRQAMPIVGKARCGDATVTFFSPPGSDATSPIGGVKFYVSVGGRKYGGAATFTCGQPGGWMEMRKLFVDSFRDNPDSNFPPE
jgi:hypothetical protein